MNRKLARAAWFFAVPFLGLSVAVAACYSSNPSSPDGGPDASGPDAAPPDASGDAGPLTVEQIFQTNCAISGCHTGGSPPQGLDLSPSAWYSNLVGVPAAEVSGLRVAPGDHANSYLWCKVDPTCTPGAGVHMPYGAAPLPQSELDAIRTWIDSLAADAGSSADGGGDGAAADTTPPSAPTGVTAAPPANTPNVLHVSWAASTDNVTTAQNLIYDVYQGTSAGGEGSTPVATTSPGVTSADIGNLATNAKYYFVVKAVDQAGNVSAASGEASGTTLNVTDTTPPTFGGATSATAQSGSAIQLAWTAATDNYTPQSSIVYLVYQATSSGGESYASPSYTTAAGATSYTVSGLNGGTTYYFVVRAKDQAGNIDLNTKEVSAATSTVHFNADVWTPIISSTCAVAGCHITGTAANHNLDMSTAAKAYSNLVNVYSGECTTTLRVKPSDPSTGGSYLMAKLDGSGPCFSGSRMPKTGSLTQTQIDLFGAWIGEGAPNN